MKTNSAINLLRHIGGTAAIMLDTKQEKQAIQEFLRQDKKDNPPEKRMPELLRQYHKRYRNNIAEYIGAIRDRAAAQS